MKLFKLSLTGIIIRFYLIMTSVLIAGFTEILAIKIIFLPIFIRALTGLRIEETLKKRIVVALDLGPSTDSMINYTANLAHGL